MKSKVLTPEEKKLLADHAAAKKAEQAAAKEAEKQKKFEAESATKAAAELQERCDNCRFEAAVYEFASDWALRLKRHSDQLTALLNDDVETWELLEGLKQVGLDFNEKD
jgi:hypothetical protein